MGTASIRGLLRSPDVQARAQHPGSRAARPWGSQCSTGGGDSETQGELRLRWPKALLPPLPHLWALAQGVGCSASGSRACCLQGGAPQVCLAGLACRAFGAQALSMALGSTRWGTLEAPPARSACCCCTGLWRWPQSQQPSTLHSTHIQRAPRFGASDLADAPGLAGHESHRSDSTPKSYPQILADVHRSLGDTQTPQWGAPYGQTRVLSSVVTDAHGH